MVSKQVTKAEYILFPRKEECALEGDSDSLWGPYLSALEETCTCLLTDHKQNFSQGFLL